MNLFTYEKGFCFVYYLSQLCGDTKCFDSFLRVSLEASLIFHFIFIVYLMNSKQKHVSNSLISFLWITATSRVNCHLRILIKCHNPWFRDAFSVAQMIDSYGQLYSVALFRSGILQNIVAIPPTHAALLLSTYLLYQALPELWYCGIRSIWPQLSVSLPYPVFVASISLCPSLVLCLPSQHPGSSVSTAVPEKQTLILRLLQWTAVQPGVLFISNNDKIKYHLTRFNCIIEMFLFF